MSYRNNIAAVVLHFRTAECTLQCLRSLYREGVQCVVVVDNSEDEGRSVSHMRQGIDELKALGLHIKLITPSRNLGFAQGVNVALDVLTFGRAIDVLLINSDALLESGSLGHMVDELKNAGFVVPSVRVDSGAKTSSLVGYYQSMFALVLRNGHLGTICYPSGCCLLIRRDQIRRGLLDSDFFFYGEDVELGRKLQDSKVGFVECRDATVFHPGSVSAKNGSMFYEYHMNRGHWLLARKLARNRMQFVLFLFTRCVSLPLRATVRSLRFHSWVPWYALVAATVDVLRGYSRNLTPPAS